MNLNVLAGPGRSVTSGPVTVHLGDVADGLLRFIIGSTTLVGCVAWVSSTRIVDALAGAKVSLVVNKEWRLRSADKSADGARVRHLLGRLKGPVPSTVLPAGVRPAVKVLAPVRVAGHTPRGYFRPPLMHHKFLVRLERGRPVAVWTGSFNFTAGAESNLENAAEIHDSKVARAYLGEFARVYSLSEPLDFKTGAAPGAPRASTVKKKPAAARRRVA